MEAREALLAIQRGLLSPTQAAALALLDEEDLTAADVAQRLGLSAQRAGNVMKALLRAGVAERRAANDADQIARWRYASVS